MKRAEQLFLVQTTSELYFVSEETHVEIIDVERIMGDVAFYIKWQHGLHDFTKYLTIEKIRYIVKAHEEWLGFKSHSYIEWKCILSDAIVKEDVMKKVGV